MTGLRILNKLKYALELKCKPNLHQILKAIKGNNHYFRLSCSIYKRCGEYTLELYECGPNYEYIGTFYGDSAEEAAGKALLWILEGEK